MFSERPHSVWRDVLVVAALYAASHVLYAVLGVRFEPVDARPTRVELSV